MDRIATLCAPLIEPTKIVGLIGVVLGYLVFIALLCAPLFLWQGWASVPLAMAAFCMVALIFMGKRQTTAFIACVVFALVPVSFSLMNAEDSQIINDFVMVIDLIVWVVGIFVLITYAISGFSQGGNMFIALICALLGLWFGSVHQQAVSEVPIVRSAAEVDVAMQAEQKKLDEAQAAIDERLKETGGKVFLESDEMDAYDIEGMTEADAEAFLRKLKEKKEAEARLKESGYTYKDRKVQRRQVEETDEDAAYADLGKEAESDASDELNDSHSYSETEAVFAKRYAGFHFLWAKLVAIVTIMLAFLAYLRQLNWTFPRLQPLPVGRSSPELWLFGSWLDKVFPKEHRVHLQTQDPEVLKFFLQTTAKKGENFVVFADDYVLDEQHLVRWSVGPLGIPARRLEHLRDDDPRFFNNSDFIFEAAWFGRYSFSVRGFEASRQFILDFLEAMKLRRETQAQARRTINLVWALEQEMPLQLFETLSYCAAQENLRLVIVDPRELPASMAEHMDGSYDADFFADLRE